MSLEDQVTSLKHNIDLKRHVRNDEDQAINIERILKKLQKFIKEEVYDKPLIAHDNKYYNTTIVVP